MEKMDTQIPYGSVGIEEWIGYHLNQSEPILSTEEWKKRMKKLFPTEAALDCVIAHDREGLAHWMEEVGIHWLSGRSCL